VTSRRRSQLTAIVSTWQRCASRGRSGPSAHRPSDWSQLYRGRFGRRWRRWCIVTDLGNFIKATSVGEQQWRAAFLARVQGAELRPFPAGRAADGDGHALILAGECRSDRASFADGATPVTCSAHGVNFSPTAPIRNRSIPRYGRAAPLPDRPRGRRPGRPRLHC
jgi:hypothetical protein